MAGIYCDGFDENGKWEASMGDLALDQSGAIVDLGQVPEWMRRRLNALAKAGTLVKYKGYWDTMLPFIGMGPLKTIWAFPEVAEAHGVAIAEQIAA